MHSQPERLRGRRRRLRPWVALGAPSRRRGPRARRAVALGSCTGQVFPLHLSKLTESKKKKKLWTTLRTSLLAATWGLHRRRTATGEQFTAREVVEACVEDVRRLVLADWQGVVSDITVMEGTHRSWFPGRHARRSLMEFETFWCPGSVIAHVSHPQGTVVPALDFRLKALD